MSRFVQARDNFILSLRNAPRNKVPQLNFLLGELSLKTGDYESGKYYLDAFKIFKNAPKERTNLANRYLENCEYALDNLADSIDFRPYPLSDRVNQFALQYFPVLTADQQQLIFTRRKGHTIQYDEDLVISFRDEQGEWSEPASLSPNINSEYNEGTCAISADGRTIIFTSCERNVFGSCDLFISYKTGEVWSYPENMGERINSAAWESQPTLTADGRTLYFISNRRGGFGKRDIWFTTRDENGNWSMAENLGPIINTQWDEVSPFIHANGQTLFFASNGYPCFGGYDMFYSERLDSVWTFPANLGYPLNTHHDEVSLFISSDGSTGYYSFETITEAGIQTSKLYAFDVSESIQVSRRSNYVYGTITDAQTGRNLGATIELHDINNNQLVGRVKSDAVNGQYLIVLTEGAEYALHVTKLGYLFESVSFDYAHQKNLEPIEMNVQLNRVRSGEKVVLNNLYFDFDSYALREKSKTELEKIVEFMTDNQTVSIEIEGHTDDQGSESYNQKLSENRAKAVYEYLLTNGVDQERLSFKGYGMEQPIVPNNSEENRQLNRRIDFRVI
jgi:outer membrane protein OmpA-like peptidoglycan-associated protein